VRPTTEARAMHVPAIMVQLDLRRFQTAQETEKLVF
jgi:hypothetical protein